MISPSDKIAVLVKDMDEFYEHAMTAYVRYSLDGIGGCKHYEVEEFPARFRKYLDDYVKTDKSSNQCCVEYLYNNGYLNI